MNGRLIVVGLLGTLLKAAAPAAAQEAAPPADTAVIDKSMPGGWRGC